MAAPRPDWHRRVELDAQVGCDGVFPIAPKGSSRAPITCTRMFAPAGAYLVHHGLVPIQVRSTCPGHRGIATGTLGAA